MATEIERAKNQAKEKKSLDGVKKAIKVKKPKSEDEDGVNEALKVTKEIKSAVLKGEAKKAEHEMNAAMAKEGKPKESFIDALEAMAKQPVKTGLSSIAAAGIDIAG